MDVDNKVIGLRSTDGAIIFVIRKYLGVILGCLEFFGPKHALQVYLWITVKSVVVYAP